MRSRSWSLHTTSTRIEVVHRRDRQERANNGPPSRRLRTASLRPRSQPPFANRTFSEPCLESATHGALDSRALPVDLFPRPACSAVLVPTDSVHHLECSKRPPCI